jgi:hypothetical protein
VIALVCLHCNHSNLADANFCSACGAGLLRRLCPSCHVANGVGAQFCHACGVRLQLSGEERAVASGGSHLSLVSLRPADAVSTLSGDDAPALGETAVDVPTEPFGATTARPGLRSGM